MLAVFFSKERGRRKGPRALNKQAVTLTSLFHTKIAECPFAGTKHSVTEREVLQVVEDPHHLTSNWRLGIDPCSFTRVSSSSTRHQHGLL